ncbi:toll/interleukin-1 receptor domain-containing protein [Actinokineospora diospyrosa]|uniref:TIR domain-containing protein n=1 Tax=Actinokineospora diospyrosa TaxID=103728 RepID=A0ABT1IAE9_9PSEU|nr:toll/interleukin-1 receptor domain-containing protein [Actinokineospora diospyrosa]MCP2269326.1 TIR domain-containing protein [Actinokineospora diospyrosa]
MTRIFLSYSSADSEIATRVAGVLRERGAEVYFEPPQDRGTRSPGAIAQEVERADAFVVLMSPAALGTEYCQVEHQMAAYRELKEQRRLLYKYRVAEGSKDGWGRLWDQVDLLPPVSQNELVDALGVVPIAGSPGPSVERSREGPFRNRHDELNRVLDAMKTSGEHDFWIVTAPPKLGKTWFLTKVCAKLAENYSDKLTTTVDLREQPLDLRHDADRLLRLLFNAEADPQGSADDLVGDLVRIILKRGRHHIAVLDSAELLDRSTVESFRILASRVFDEVNSKPSKPDTRMTLVVASRRAGEWSGMNCQGEPVLDFRVVNLSEFGDRVVRDMLNEISTDSQVEFQRDHVTQWTAALQQLSVGLPALLVRSVEWARIDQFYDSDACSDYRVFDTVVRPYVEGELLSMHTLVEPGDKIAERYGVLLKALELISAYRMVTTSHLKHHLDHDAEFGAALTEAAWAVEDLWDAIGKTALVTGVSDLWHSLFPPFRALLCKHFHRDDERRRVVHSSARELYEGLAANGINGSDRVRVFLELIWHEAMLLQCTDAGGLAAKLPDTAAALAKRVIQPDTFGPAFGPAEFRASVRRQLREDREFAALTKPHNGLFDAVLTSVAQNIGGGT